MRGDQPNLNNDRDWTKRDEAPHRAVREERAPADSVENSVDAVPGCNWLLPGSLQ
jgi:hypothetical protein